MNLRLENHTVNKRCFQLERGISWSTSPVRTSQRLYWSSHSL